MVYGLLKVKQGSFMRARRLVAVLSALAVAVVVPVVSAPVASADPCPSLYVVAIPGTWEPSGTRPGAGMLAPVTNGLPGSVRTDYVTYSATAFPWESNVYAKSKQQAVDNARGMIGAMAASCGDTRFAIVGYSQGADAAGDLAAEIGTGIGVVPPTRVEGVGLLSDPRRSESDVLIGPAVGGNGASGPRIGGFGWLSGKTVTLCAVGALYCSTPKDDFVMRLAGFMAQASDPTPASALALRDEAAVIVNDLITAGGLPALMAQLDPGANSRRIDQLVDFYGSQVHTDYTRYVVDGAGNSATSWLHGWLAGKA